MKFLQNIIIPIFLALIEFLVLVYGCYGIYTYAVANVDQGGTDVPAAAAGLGVLFEFIFFSSILTIIWYGLLVYFLLKAEKQNKTTLFRAHIIAMILPVVSAIGYYWWG